MLAFPLYTGQAAMTRLVASKNKVAHGDTDITMTDIPAAPLQFVEAAVPGMPADHCYIHVADNANARLIPSYGNTYGKQAGLGTHAYQPGQPVRTETHQQTRATCWYGYVWIKTVAADGSCCYQHSYAGTEGRSHPATTLYMGCDGTNVVLQVAPHYWQKSVDLRARVLAAEARVKELEARLAVVAPADPVAVAPVAAVRNPDLAPLAVLPRGTAICFDRKRAGETLQAIFHGETVEGADGRQYGSLSTWLKNALGYKTANGWEGTYAMVDGAKVWMNDLRGQ
jgi:hypothetical protein